MDFRLGFLYLSLFLLPFSSSLSLGLFASSNSSLLFSPPHPVDHTPAYSLFREIVRAAGMVRSEVRDLEVEEGSVRVGISQRYEVKAKVGRLSALAWFSDDEVAWERPSRNGIGVVVDPAGLELVAGDGVDVSVPAAVREVVVIGPAEVRVRREVESISVQLSNNTTYSGLRKVFVAKGIAVTLLEAEHVSFSHPYDIGLLRNGFLVTRNNSQGLVTPIQYSYCSPLLDVQVSGSVVLMNTIQTFGAYVKASYKSSDTIQLFREKCSADGRSRYISACTFCSVPAKLAAMHEELLIQQRIKRWGDNPIRFVKAKITSSKLVKFRVRLLKEVTEDDGLWKKIEHWKTRPTVQHVWLEVTTRAEDGGVLKAVLIKKIKRTVPQVESRAWTNLTSNMSFTQFASFILPLEPLTLDVKW